MRHRRIRIVCACLLLSVVSYGGLLAFSRKQSLLPSDTHVSQVRPAASPKYLTATPKRPLATPIPRPTFSALRVEGTHIVNADDEVMMLIGASRSSLEYSCTGDGHFQLSDFEAMRSWGMNTVRIPLSSAFWANLDGACPNYHQTVEAAVSNAEAAGLYVILDLHWNAPFSLPQDATGGGGQYPMPDTGKDVAFWEDIATHYHSDPAVIFELFNEPHQVSWNTWYWGGPVWTQLYDGVTVEDQTGSYQAIGMQDLVNKVRAIAPDNLISITGVYWGFDLSGLLQDYALQASNIVYSTHPYDYGDKQLINWPDAFGDVADQVATISTEFGSYDCESGYVAQAIAYFEAHMMSWIAWNWSPDACSDPSLLADWSGTPNYPYGAFIRLKMIQSTQSTDLYAGHDAII
ncbi:MAG TPA: glycoside hydrolase family 5 protein [Ktedonobacteraceae bacterium]|nr:glycoside hydrolase family 5 protein [Ktedonobacteraceae bacterium]